MDKDNRDKITGRFATSNPEPAKANLNVRVPASLKIQVQAVAGDRLPDWLREAVLEKLERETLKACSN